MFAAREGRRKPKQCQKNVQKKSELLENLLHGKMETRGGNKQNVQVQKAIHRRRKEG